MDGRRGVLLEIFTVAGFCAFLFFFGLDSFGLVGADEPRYAQIAREMLDRHDWITPTLYGQPWLEKPALYYWRAAAAFQIFGVSDWAARLPASTAATVMVGVVYFFMRRFHPGAQLNAALLTAACVGMVGFGRGAGPDMQLGATFGMGMLAWYAWHETGRKLWLAVFYLLMALGTLAKGPVAPVLAVLIVVVFAALRRELRLVLRTLWLPGVLLFLVVALPWYVMVQLRNPTFFYAFIVEHNFARFATNLYRHKQPFWYYVPVLLLGVLPWSGWVIAGIWDAVRGWRRARGSQSEDRLPIFLVIWAAVIVVFFSISGSKLPGYILPAVPACTVLAADYLERRQSGRLNSGLIAVQAALLALLIALALLFPNLLLHRNQAIPSGARLIAGGVACLVAIATYATLRLHGLRAFRVVTLAPVIVALAFLLRVGGPALDNAFSARPLARDIGQMESGRAEVAVFKALRETEYGLAFYRNHGIPRYERGEIPAKDHLVVAPEGSRDALVKLLAGRRVSRLGGFAPQRLEYFWISTSPAQHEAAHQH